MTTNPNDFNGHVPDLVFHGSDCPGHTTGRPGGSCLAPSPRQGVRIDPSGGARVNAGIVIGQMIAEIVGEISARLGRIEAALGIEEPQ